MTTVKRFFKRLFCKHDYAEKGRKHISEDERREILGKETLESMIIYIMDKSRGYLLSCGIENNFSVLLYSITSPSTKNAVLSDTRTACCILCVTMTIV